MVIFGKYNIVKSFKDIGKMRYTTKIQRLGAYKTCFYQLSDTEIQLVKSGLDLGSEIWPGCLLNY